MFRKYSFSIASIFVALIIGLFGTGATSLARPVPPGAGAQAGGSAAPLVAVGSGFTYQGRLMFAGQPAVGQYDFEFTLFDAATGGTVIGSPVAIGNQTVDQGLFTVTLDFGAGAFQGQARWLEIAVRQAGSSPYTTLAPRQALTAAPYALNLLPGAVVTGTRGSPLLLTSNGDGVGTYGKSIHNDGLVGESAEPGRSGVFGYNTASGGYGLSGRANAGSNGGPASGATPTARTAPASSAPRSRAAMAGACSAGAPASAWRGTPMMAPAYGAGASPAPAFWARAPITTA